MPTIRIHCEPGRYAISEIDVPLDVYSVQLGLVVEQVFPGAGPPSMFSLLVALPPELRDHCLALPTPVLTLRFDYACFNPIITHMDYTIAGFSDAMPVPVDTFTVLDLNRALPILAGPGHLGSYLGHNIVDVTAALTTPIPTTHIRILVSRPISGGLEEDILFVLARSEQEVITG